MAATFAKPALVTPGTPPYPEFPCYACGGERWWLLDSVVWRCDGCHPPIGTPSRRAHPGRITFTVASHHWDNAAFLADPNAFTIMAWPPKGWPEDRNLDLFAAESETVRAYRDGEITAAQYTQQFSSLMQERLPWIRNWLWQHDGQHVTLLSDSTIHRPLVVKLLVWLGCEQVAWEATRQEATPTPQPTPATGRIYVDELVGWGVTPAPGAARYFGNGKQSCHLATDDHSEAGLEALHQFAKKIGMQRRWFQDHRVMPHYDLTPSKHALAVKAGAIEVRPTDLVRICGREAWAERQEGQVAA